MGIVINLINLCVCVLCLDDALPIGLIVGLIVGIFIIIVIVGAISADAILRCLSSPRFHIMLPLS